MSKFDKLKKLYASARHRELRRGCRYAVAPAIEHDAFLRSLPQLGSIADVGANKGQFALVARRIHPAARITAFEPLPKAGRRFAQVFRTDDKVILHHVAIGSGASVAELHVSARDDSSSLLPITDLQESTFPGTRQRRIERVQVCPLSALVNHSDIPSPALIKIDVQGGELDVLAGIGELLPLFDYVYVEASFVEFYSGQPLAHEVVSYMTDHDFKLTGVYNPTLNKFGQSVQADFLFTPLSRKE